MLRTLARVAAGTIAAAVLVFSGATGASAANPIGPKQYFNGFVNGANPSASIMMGCFGPIGGQSTGHPLAGQFVYASQALSSTTTNIGYTGDSARSLTITLVLPPVTPTGPIRVYPIGTIVGYDQKLEIPISLTLPCYGTGSVVFAPTPTSATARSSTVKVTLVGQP